MCNISQSFFIWEIFGSKSVVCECSGLWDECCVVGEAVSDVLKDRIVLVFEVQEAHKSISLWSSRNLKANSVLRSETARTTCPLTQNCILEDPIPSIGIPMDVEVSITCCITQALQFSRTTDGRVLFSWK